MVPTAIQLAVHSVPTDILPDDNNQLYLWLKQSIQNAKAIPIRSARYLNKDRNLRLSKEKTSLVISVDPEHVEHLLPSLFVFSERLKVEKIVQANRYTQCTNCYRSGHASQRCKQKHPSCPYCSLRDTRAAHRCQNPTCPKGGYEKPVSSCCPTSLPLCPNCSCDHDAFSRECMARPIPPPRQELPPHSDDDTASSLDGEEDVEMEGNGPPTPTTPEAPMAHTINLTTLRPSQRANAPTGTDGPPPTGTYAHSRTPSHSRAEPDNE